MLPSGGVVRYTAADRTILSSSGMYAAASAVPALPCSNKMRKNWRPPLAEHTGAASLVLPPARHPQQQLLLNAYYVSACPPTAAAPAATKRFFNTGGAAANVEAPVADAEREGTATDGRKAAAQGGRGLGRRPRQYSRKVEKLAVELVSLSQEEADELCKACTERLTPYSNRAGTSFPPTEKWKPLPPGIVPFFPHPLGLFAAATGAVHIVGVNCPLMPPAATLVLMAAASAVPQEVSAQSKRVLKDPVVPAATAAPSQ